MTSLRTIARLLSMVVLAQSLIAQAARIDGTPQPTPASTAARVAGQYLLDPGNVVTVSRVAGGLTVQWNDKTPTWLWPRTGGLFRVSADTSFQLRFTGESPAARFEMTAPDGSRTVGRRAAPPAADASLDDDAWPAARAGALFDSLAVADSLLFDAFYVRCDADATIRMFVSNAEFYHDQSGAKLGADALNAFRNNCPRDKGVRRVLIPGSVRVFPLADYGAVQMGRHAFVQGDGSQQVAKFIQLWQRTAEGWRATRTISFDHRWRRAPAPTRDARAGR